MKKEAAIKVITGIQSELAKHGVSKIFLFGSVARDEAGPESDIDVLVEFDRPIGIFEFMDLKDLLENSFKQRVDLVTPDALKEQLRPQILKEAVRAA